MLLAGRVQPLLFSGAFFALVFELCHYVSAVVFPLIAVLILLYIRDKRRRYFFNVLILSALLFFALGEFFFRLHYLGPQAILNFSRYVPAGLGHPLTDLQYDEKTYTGLAANQDRLFQGRRFLTNSLGFRDEDYAFQKPADTVRVMVCGTSLSTGNGVHQGEPYPDQLEQMLNQMPDSSQNYEVINLSRGAYGVDDCLDAVAKVGRKYQPDFIILEPRWTNTGLHPIPRVPDAGPLGRIFSQNTWLAMSFFYQAMHREFVAVRVERFLTFKQMLLMRAGKAGQEEQASRAGVMVLVEDYLKTFKTAWQDIPFFIVTLRPINQLHRPFHVGSDEKALYAKYQIQHIDTTNADYGTYGSDRVVYPGDTHPNAKAHRIYASVILEALRPYLIKKAV